MKRHGAMLWGFLTIYIMIFSQDSTAAGLEKIKFPYTPIAIESLPWWLAKEAKLFEKYGLDVEMFFEGASSAIVQAMLTGEANLAGLAGPAVISNVLKRRRYHSSGRNYQDAYDTDVRAAFDQKLGGSEGVVFLNPYSKSWRQKEPHYYYKY